MIGRRRVLRTGALVGAVALLAAACGSGGGSSTGGSPPPSTSGGAAAAKAVVRGDQAGAAVGQHWHAAFGVNDCGRWLPNAPFFEAASGIHSHGDGLIHIHPFTEAAAGRGATVGTFLAGAGWSATATSFDLGGGQAIRNGDRCAGGAGVVRWSVNGVERHGDIAGYAPRDGDVIALAFLPAGTPIGTPPQAQALREIADVTH